MKRISALFISVAMLFVSSYGLASDVQRHFRVHHRIHIMMGGDPDVLPVHAPSGKRKFKATGDCKDKGILPMPGNSGQELIASTATQLTCSADRNVPGPSAYGRFCECLRDVTASGTNQLYPKIGPERFSALEEQAMQAAIAMKVNSLRGPLRDLALGLTYAAFNTTLRPMIAPMQVGDGPISSPKPRDGLACIPGNMGNYIDKLKKTGVCKAQAIKRLDDGMDVVLEPHKNGEFAKGRLDRNFGDVLDRVYTRTFSEGFGIQHAQTLDPGFLQDPRLTEGVAVGASFPASKEEDESDMEVPAEDVSPSETPLEVVATNSDGEILYEALQSMLKGEAVQISPAQSKILKMNGLIAPYLRDLENEDENEEIPPEKLEAFLIKIKEFIKGPKGTMAKQERFIARFNRFLKRELKKTLSDCEEKILKPLKETICPLIGEEKFSITALLGVLSTPEERENFSELMGKIGGASSAIQSEQLMCYAYGGKESSMEDIFNYENAAPVSTPSVVFSIPENISTHDTYPSPAHENQKERTLITKQRTQGHAIRTGEITGQVKIDLPRVEEIARQSSSKYRENRGGANNAASGAKSAPEKMDELPNAVPEKNDDAGFGTNAFANSGGSLNNFGGGASVLPTGGGVSDGPQENANEGSVGKKGPETSGAVDYAARIAELQKMLEDREQKLKEATSRQDTQSGDSLVSAARDREAEVRDLKEQIKSLRADLTNTKAQAAASGATIPEPKPVASSGAVPSAKVAPGTGTSALVPAPKAGSGVSPGPIAPRGGSTTPMAGASGESLSGYDLSSSLGFVSRMKGMALTLNGVSFAPHEGQLLIPRSEFEGADTVRRQQMYTLANGAPIYVVNEDQSVTVYTAKSNAEGIIAYMPEGSSAPVPPVGKVKKGKGRSIASEGAPVVAPGPEKRIRHQDLLNLMGGEGVTK